jgi:hypothetical protein
LFLERITIRYPNIKYQECCNTQEKKEDFLRECTKAYEPAICVAVIPGSAIITFSDDTSVLKVMIEQEIDSCDFPKFTSSGNTLVLLSEHTSSLMAIIQKATCSCAVRRARSAG